MKILRLPILILAAAILTPVIRADFHDHVGIQLWSLRANTLTKGVPSSLDLVKGWGIVEVEGGLVTANMTAEQVRAAVDARGLKMPSAHVGYDDLKKDLPALVHAAQVLGVHHVICPWIPHEGPFTPATVEQAAAIFNRAGAAFRAAGIKFGYHPHGYEFVPTATAGETLLDDLIKATKPEDVCYQMDVFWVYHGGGDPVKLLNKYAGRWVSLHVKDIRKGAPYGLPLGHAPDTDNVAVGAGQMDWKAVIGTAQKVGVTYYFIEDETPAPLDNIPATQAFLRTLKL
jgi:sugar phosphate isomerase/epimerase